MYRLQQNAVSTYLESFRQLYHQLYILPDERRNRRNHAEQRAQLPDNLVTGSSFEARSTSSCRHALSEAGPDRLEVVSKQQGETFVREHVGQWVAAQQIRLDEETPSAQSLAEAGGKDSVELRMNEEQAGLDDNFTSLSQATNYTASVAIQNVDGGEHEIVVTTDHEWLQPESRSEERRLAAGNKNTDMIVSRPVRTEQTTEQTIRDAVHVKPLSPISESMREGDAGRQNQPAVSALGKAAIPAKPADPPPRPPLLERRSFTGLPRTPLFNVRPTLTSTVNKPSVEHLVSGMDVVHGTIELRDQMWDEEQQRFEQRLRHGEDDCREKVHELDRLRSSEHVLKDDIDRQRRDHEMLRDLYLQCEDEKATIDREKLAPLSKLAELEQAKRTEHSSRKVVRLRTQPT